MSSEPCKHERAPQSDVDAFGVLGGAGSRFEPGEADPAWRQWARDEIRRLRGERDSLAEDVQFLREELAQALSTTFQSAITCTEEVDADRDALAEKVRRVEALTYASGDGTEFEHLYQPGCDAEPACPACWARNIRAALADPEAKS